MLCLIQGVIYWLILQEITKIINFDVLRVSSMCRNTVILRVSCRTVEGIASFNRYHYQPIF